MICVMMLLYWATRLARVACELGSATGATAAADELKGAPLVETVVPVIAPIVEDAASFEVVMVIAPLEESIEACRLFAASAVLSWLSVETWFAPVPKVMLVAVPPPVAIAWAWTSGRPLLKRRSPWRLPRWPSCCPGSRCPR